GLRGRVVPDATHVVATRHATASSPCPARSGRLDVTSLTGIPQHAIPGTAEPGWPELCAALQDLLPVCGTDDGTIDLQRLKSRVYRLRAAVELFADLHVRAAGHALLPECRHFCGNLGMPFFVANVRDAIAVLEALAPPRVEPSSEEGELRGRLLTRLYRLRDEIPERA